MSLLLSMHIDCAKSYLDGKNSRFLIPKSRVPVLVEVSCSSLLHSQFCVLFWKKSRKKNTSPLLCLARLSPMCIVCKTLAVWKTVGRVMSALDMKSDSVETSTHTHTHTHTDDGDLNVWAISSPPSCPSTHPRAYNLHISVWEKWISHDCRSCADAGRRCCVWRGCRREIKHPMAPNRICHFIKASKKTRY